MLGAVRLVVLAIVIVVASPAEAGPRRGKVVRVERPRTGSRGTPRICQLKEGTTGMCWGKAPVVGESAWVIDAQKMRGTIRITKVEPSDAGCAVPQYWGMEYEAIDADLDGIEPYSPWALVDVDLSPRARVVDPQSVKTPDDQDQAWLAIDRGRGDVTSDATADFMVVAFSCAEDGLKQTSGGYGTGYCLDYWVQISGRWSQVRRDVVVNCRN